MRTSLSLLCLMGAAFLLTSTALAGDLEWSGTYRAEGYHLSNSELSGDNRELNYGLHHLILKPKIVAADGLNIYGRFDVLNAAATTYPGSQFGDVFGIGSGATNTGAQAQSFSSFQVSQLYLSFIQEFGSLVVGRAPVQFGLGITHDAGNGLFDHWMDTRDMVGYKFVFGNLFILPMYGKVVEANLGQADDVTDKMVQVQYENPETGMSMGVFYQTRQANFAANDAPVGTAPGEAYGGAGVKSGAYDVQTINVYTGKEADGFFFGVEAGFQNGDVGVSTGGGDGVTINAYGVAGELSWKPEDSRFSFGAHMGVASGDNPDTDDVYEGFIFDRNYDVAFLLFNHPLGQADFFRTSVLKGAHPASINEPDVEAISNVMYISPAVDYQWTDQWSVGARLTTGFISQSPAAGMDVDKDLGYELDLSLKFMPNERVAWVNQAGLLMPGSAFEGDGSYSSKFAYGLTTKAAISF